MQKLNKRVNSVKSALADSFLEPCENDVILKEMYDEIERLNAELSHLKTQYEEQTKRIAKLESVLGLKEK